MSKLKLPAHYYQQFDADFTRDVPAEGYGGWKTAEIELAIEHTAVVVMHAWDCGTREQFPGWHRAVEYIPRADAICRDVFPGLLSAVRASPLPLMHVVSGNHPGLEEYSGYRKARDLAGPEDVPERIEADESLTELHRFRNEHIFVGPHNQEDTRRGFEQLDFPPQAKPQGDEGIAATSEQLFALCKESNINHLIYAGFAIDGCLLLSPGGMIDMSRRGVMCSTFQQAVTAIENKETAREEVAKQIALWRVALSFGFVFDVDAFVQAIAEPDFSA